VEKFPSVLTGDLTFVDILQRTFYCSHVYSLRVGGILWWEQFSRTASLEERLEVNPFDATRKRSVLYLHVAYSLLTLKIWSIKRHV
jgi:hypothetical protein